MKIHPSSLLLAALCSAGPISAQTPAPATAPAAPAAAPAPLPPQAPDVAAPKMDPKTGAPNAGFVSAHERFVATAKENKAKLLFLGDSITAGWGGQKAIWTTAFGEYEPANFGIGGDRTQHVLWRITNGELDGINPKVTVVMIGTNNIGHFPNEEPEWAAAGCAS